MHSAVPRCQCNLCSARQEVALTAGLWTTLMQAVSKCRGPGVSSAALQHAAVLQQAFPLTGRGMLPKDRTHADSAMQEVTNLQQAQTTSEQDHAAISRPCRQIASTTPVPFASLQELWPCRIHSSAGQRCAAKLESSYSNCALPEAAASAGNLG